jgi:hypothetical protein
MQSLRLVARPRGSQDSIKVMGEGKIKFVIQAHVDKKTMAPLLPIWKNAELPNLITSKLPQSVK